MPRLTKRFVENVQAPAPGAAHLVVWDAELKGFGLVVLPSGTRSYVVQYRNGAGRLRRVTIGRHGIFTADQARADARQLLALAARGGDPLEERRTRRAAASVSELLDRYLTEHVEVNNAATTATEIRRLVERHLRPALGRLKVTEVSSADLARLHASLKRTPRMANLVLSVASKLFNLAEVWQLRPQYSNPVRGIVRFAENSRKTSLSDAQLGALGAAFRDAETVGLPWHVGDEPSKNLPADPSRWRTRPNQTALVVLRLILLTGARLSEVLMLRWEHVDLERGTLALPEHKGAARVPHPVGDAALQLVRDMKTDSSEKAVSRRQMSPWVFPRDDDSTRHVAKEVVEKVWRLLRRRAALGDIRIHDLRHAFGTFAGRGGNAFLVRDALRHENLTMTNRYVSADEDPLRALNRAVEGRILYGLGTFK